MLSCNAPALVDVTRPRPCLPCHACQRGCAWVGGRVCSPESCWDVQQRNGTRVPGFYHPVEFGEEIRSMPVDAPDCITTASDGTTAGGRQYGTARWLQTYHIYVRQRARDTKSGKNAVATTYSILAALHQGPPPAVSHIAACLHNPACMSLRTALGCHHLPSRWQIVGHRALHRTAWDVLKAERADSGTRPSRAARTADTCMHLCTF